MERRPWPEEIWSMIEERMEEMLHLDRLRVKAATRGQADALLEKMEAKRRTVKSLVLGLAAEDGEDSVDYRKGHERGYTEGYEDGREDYE